MKVLVTGATGKVGSAVVAELRKRGAEVRAMAHKPPAPGQFPAGVEVAVGDLLDPVSTRLAMRGVDKLFLLNAVVPDELTQALIAYGIAKQLGLQQVTYLSVFKVDQFRDVPHFASKLAVEGALREFGLPYTILRPGYFFQNDARNQPALAAGIYPIPLGSAGIAAVDVRDIAEIAALSLTSGGHLGQTYSVVGPAPLSGPGAAAVWSQVLGRPIRYAGEDFDAFEEQVRAFAPSWSAFDFRVMFQFYLERGFAQTPTEIARCAALLGHAPRSYADWAREAAPAMNL